MRSQGCPDHHPAATTRTILTVVLLLFLCASSSLAAEEQSSSKPCRFPAIFNFGDSNSDTGGISAVFYPIVMPYGQTFFGKAVGRASDGRLMVDFFAESLGLPYLSAYLNSVGANYHGGANFATGSSTIMMPNETFFKGGRRFGPPAEICCGYFKDDIRVMCANRDVVNGTEIYGEPCANPSSIISWDGVHYSFRPSMPRAAKTMTA